MKRPLPTSIPVTVVTGFLGSGKTTLLQRLLVCPEARATAVLINEIGEIGLDHLLVNPVCGPASVLADAPVAHFAPNSSKALPTCSSMNGGALTV